MLARSIASFVLVSLTLPALALPSFALAPMALAGGVGNVSHSPVVVHADLQTAIDAAADGDVLLVHGGTYSGFTIDARSLALFAIPGETVNVVGRCEIKNVPSSKRVVLSDLSLRGAVQFDGDGDHALVVSNCAGPVWIQGCTLRGENGLNAAGAEYGGYGGHGAAITNASSVVLVAASCAGGNGGAGSGVSGYFSGDGGHAIEMVSSLVALYDVTASGGAGGADPWQQSVGGRGIVNSSGTLFASSVSATGGSGDFPGTGLWTSGPTYTLDCVFSSVSGTVVALTPQARSIQLPHVASATAQTTATLTGEAGDAFRLPSSTSSDWLLQLASNGVWSIPYPAAMPKAPFATLPATGTFAATWKTPQVAPGSLASLRFTQGFVLPEDGGAVLASPACTLLLDVAGQPDCNGNGRWDVIDIVLGALDVNSNFKPDACEGSSSVWYVDDDAAAGGDGSLAAPFQTIRAATDAALVGHTIVVLDGTYTGVQNTSLTLGGKTLVVKSQNGPANCVIDCANSGRAFHVSAGSGAGTKIEGFTIRGGSGDNGGAVLVDFGATLELAGCIFESNTCWVTGGAVSVQSSTGGITLVRDCVFNGNSAPNGRGGAIAVGQDTRIERCVFVGNSASRGGALYIEEIVLVDLSHSSFFANNAVTRGGAIFIEVVPTTIGVSRLRVSHALFVGNNATLLGGAISALRAGTGSLHLEVGHCTLTANSTFGSGATSGGGALDIEAANLTLVDSILWQNSSASVGPQIRLQNSTAVVSYSDVEGGSVAVHNSGSTLTWGAGNLDVDPEFVDADGMDNDPLTYGDNVYRLKPISPCLDAGDSIHALPDFNDIDGDLDFGELVPLDFNLKPRFKDLPSIPDTGIGSPPIDLGCYERQG